MSLFIILASYTDARSNLTPGGWVELQEVDVIMGCDDGTLSENDTLAKWCKPLEEAAAKLERKLAKAFSFKGYLADAEFTEIVETRFKWPTNRWPKDPKYKELGAWNNENSNILLEGLTLAPFTRGLAWSVEEVKLFLVKLRKEFNDPKIHAY